MASFDHPERDIATIRLEPWGKVVPAPGTVPWLLLDPSGQPVEPVAQFLRDFVVSGNAGGSVRSYAYALQRWWRFLQAVGVRWDRATSVENRDFVLWAKAATKQPRSPRTKTRALAGRINPVTRKRHLDDGYQPRTIRHSNAVVRAFYFWIERGEGPLVNPVPRNRPQGRRPNAHHNPMEPFRSEGKLRYNPPLPKNGVEEPADSRWRYPRVTS
ncbi:hypothetical protein [Nonomuraea sp. NPDC049158]|uniref:hypothetical protein n=1 Tax=Nonomuraea sp. NPDC049158 TaxID=3155649 RepID=UPI0033C9F101